MVRCLNEKRKYARIFVLRLETDLVGEYIFRTDNTHTSPDYFTHSTLSSSYMVIIQSGNRVTE